MCHGCSLLVVSSFSPENSISIKSSVIDKMISWANLKTCLIIFPHYLTDITKCPSFGKYDASIKQDSHKWVSLLKNESSSVNKVMNKMFSPFPNFRIHSNLPLLLRRWWWKFLLGMFYQDLFPSGHHSYCFHYSCLC